MAVGAHSSRSDSIVVVNNNTAKTKVTHSYTLHKLHIVLIRHRSVTANTAKHGRNLLRDNTHCTMASTRSTHRYVDRGRVLGHVTHRYIRPAGNLFVALPRSSLSFRTAFVHTYRRTKVDTRTVSPRRTHVVRPTIGPTLVNTIGIPSNAISPFHLATTGVLSTGRRNTIVLATRRIAKLVHRNTAIYNIHMHGRLANRARTLRTPIIIGTTKV